MKLSELLNESTECVRAKGIPESALHLLMADTLQLGMADLVVEGEKEITEQTKADWDAKLARLIKGEPPQYISGHACFWGLTIGVGPGVLIPRPETEGLVELVLHHLHPEMRVLDCCTGSGAIALLLKKFRPCLTVHATDNSPEALAIARVNATSLGLEVEFFRCDLFPKDEAAYHIIVANPPYVSKKDYQKLDRMVKEYEPRSALVSGRLGLSHIKRILSRGQKHLVGGGLFFLEHGDAQRSLITDLAGKYGWKLNHAQEDLAGKPRYLVFEKRKLQG